MPSDNPCHTYHSETVATRSNVLPCRGAVPFLYLQPYDSAFMDMHLVCPYNRILPTPKLDTNGSKKLTESIKLTVFANLTNSTSPKSFSRRPGGHFKRIETKVENYP